MIRLARTLAILVSLSAAGCAAIPESGPDTAVTPTPPAMPEAPAAPSAPSAPSAPAAVEAAPVPDPAPAARTSAAAPAPRPPAATRAAPARPPAAVASAPPAPSPAAGRPPSRPVAPAPAVKPATPPLDLAALETRLRETRAIGVLTKISLKNQVDDLLDRFRAYYKRQAKTTLADLRRPYDMLLLKVLSLLQDSDPPLAQDIVASREAIWGILADPEKFNEAKLMAGETP
ncbi:MAG: hypothetical protein ABIX37_04315 [Gammaproteobacteria bacterium]